MTTVGDLIVELMLAVAAAGFVVVWGRIVLERRWSSAIAILASLLVLALVVLLPNRFVRAASEIDPIPAIAGILGAAVVVALVVIVRDSSLRGRRKFLSAFARWNSGFVGGAAARSWTSSTEKRSASGYGGSQGIRFPGLPPLLIPDGYWAGTLSSLASNKGLGEQVATYHLVGSEDYVSWVDAAYWAVLRQLAMCGVAVSIYISKGRDRNPMFAKYVRAIAGSGVRVDQDVYDRLQLQGDDPLVDPIDIPKTGGGASPSEDLKYEKLRAFAGILPLLLGRPHSLVLIWEDYYENYVASGGAVKNPVVQIGGSTGASGGAAASLALGGYKTAFLLVPSAVGVDCEGREVRLLPSETMLLGESSPADMQRQLDPLPNASLRCIVSSLLGPVLSCFERWCLTGVSELLLLLRRDRVVGEVRGKRDRATVLLAWVLCRVGHIVHYRISRHEG